MENVNVRSNLPFQIRPYHLDQDVFLNNLFFFYVSLEFKILMNFLFGVEYNGLLDYYLLEK